MDGCNPGSGGCCGGGSKMNGGGGSEMNGSRYSSSIPKEGGIHLSSLNPEPEPVKLQAPRIPKCEQVTLPDPGDVQASNHVYYTTLPGCCLTKAQDQKILEIAHAKKTEIPLHAASMDKRSVSLKDSRVCIPLKLVMNHFKNETTKATIQLEAPDKKFYSVGASKHGDDQIVMDCEWGTFAASHNVQEKDVLLFRNTGESRLEVCILDPSGHEKNPSCAVTGNHQETSEDSMQIVDPPLRAVIDLSSSDEDDDLVREGTEEFRWAQKRVTRSCAKTLKIASTSSPCTKSGYGASKLHEGAPVVTNLPDTTSKKKTSKELALDVTLLARSERKRKTSARYSGSEWTA